jgi:hypothetical protein
MMHGFQHIVTQAERRYNFVVHGLPPVGDEMACFTPNLEQEAHGFNKWQLGLYINEFMTGCARYSAPAASDHSKNSSVLVP